MTLIAGGASIELEDRVPRHGVIYQVVSLDAPGTIEVRVRSADHRTKRGRVQLRIARWTRRTATRHARSANSDSRPSGRRQNRSRGRPRESWARAADKLHEAITHFEAADDDAMRAQAAYSLGHLQYESA